MNRSGFTLIEALVAIALVAVVLPVALAAVSDGIRTIERARRADLARRVADARLARLLADGSWSGAATSGDCSADDGEDAVGLRWKLTITAWRDTAVSDLRMDVSWPPYDATTTVGVETLATAP